MAMLNTYVRAKVLVTLEYSLVSKRKNSCPLHGMLPIGIMFNFQVLMVDVPAANTKAGQEPLHNLYFHFN